MTKDDPPFDRGDIISTQPGVNRKLTEEQAKLLDTLASGFETKRIAVYGADPLHIGYFDKSSRDVNNSALMKMQEEGLAIIHAGSKKLPRDNTQRHAYIEAKPRAYLENNFW